MQWWSGGQTSKGGCVGQMVALPTGVFKSRHIAASAVVAVLIIVAVTPTAPSTARAITKSIVVLWILLDGGSLFSINQDIGLGFIPLAKKDMENNE
jgi:hypothetical protein